MNNAMILGSITINKKTAVPLQRQLTDNLRQQLMRGVLVTAVKLPSTRTLSLQLGVSRNTVMFAYEQLIAEGYLTGQQGSGTRVADFRQQQISSEQSKSIFKEKDETPTFDRSSIHSAPAFITGMPDYGAFPLDTWSRILGRVSRNAAPALLGYNKLSGESGLIKQVVKHLRETRGVNCDPEQIIITNGAQAALDMIVRLLLKPNDRVLIENPSYPGMRAVLQQNNVKVVPITVDSEGISLSQAKRRLPAELIFVTPSYQYPLGITMSLKRRIGLLEFAVENDCWILEDDYDSDLRYQGRPLPALQGLDKTGRVIYTGTFSKAMFSALRIGYAVIPHNLREQFCRLMNTSGQQPSALLQQAMAVFMQEGHYAAHIRKMQKLYYQKQLHLIECLQNYAGKKVRVQSTDAGMQVIAWLDDDKSRVSLKSKLFDQGITVKLLSDYYEGNCPREGLLLGYAGIDYKQIDYYCRRLGQAIASDH